MSETSCLVTLFGITGTLLYLPYERGGVKLPNLRWNYTAGVTSRSHLVKMYKIKDLYMDIDMYPHPQPSKTETSAGHVEGNVYFLYNLLMSAVKIQQ